MDEQTESSEETFPFGQSVCWKPAPETVQASNLGKFMARYGIASLPDLQSRSIDDPEWFWDAVLKDLDIQFSTPYESVLDRSDGPHFPVWCVNGRMNIVHNCLDKWITDETSQRTAFRFESEDGRRVTYSYEELNRRVCQCANALRSIGLGPGDAIGLFMPMCPDLVVAFLAIVKIGAVILPLFSGYGPQAISTRLNDASAKAVFTADGFYRRGRPVLMKSTLDDALMACPTVQTVIVSSHVGNDEIDWIDGRDVWWNDLVPGHAETAETEDTSAEDVVMIIYTSGTTGRPKGAVHTHCGFPVKAAQDMAHAMDVRPGDTMYWMSDMGWMMGPWLVFGTLLLGASMVFYDGAPDFPDQGRLWRIVQDHKVTHLGLSPVLIRALMPGGTTFLEACDVSTLRAVGSTGSPWDPDSWRWVFSNVLNEQKPILNYSGGTEISGGILCGNFLTPMKPTSFSGPVPGMAADVVDELGNSVRGKVGELVIRGPWIGMTRGFWNDRERYLETYWGRYQGVWVHGDFAAVDSDGLWYILGRSDDTIKVAGKRLGPAEVESILNAHQSVQESAAIGIPHDIKGEELAVYCVLRAGSTSSESLRNELIDLVTRQLGKPLKPGFLGFCSSLPKTRNAKVMRRLIRSVHLGLAPGDLSSLEDESTLEAIRTAT